MFDRMWLLETMSQRCSGRQDKQDGLAPAQNGGHRPRLLPKLLFKRTDSRHVGQLKAITDQQETR